jgi:hypothetical protein
MKICNKCKLEKELAEFNKDNKGKFGVKGRCKQCIKEYDKIHYKNNTDAIKLQTKQWKQSNPNYYKEWQEKKGRLYFKEYYDNNKDKFVKYINKYIKRKKLEDPFFKLKANIRTRISQSISGYSKSQSTLDILGVKDFNELKQYIESKFSEGMNWDNYGWGENKWVIDHILPIDSAKNEQEIYKINHHTNLQPMWWRENMVKGAKLI